jgi:DNA-binding NarL/FixJ family response regulator
MKLLIVEDEMIIAMRLEQFVKELGHQVCAMASTEAGAIASAGTHRPDVVLMDLRLAHGGSGAEAACQIYKTFGIRSIVVSANIDGERGTTCQRDLSRFVMPGFRAAWRPFIAAVARQAASA